MITELPLRTKPVFRELSVKLKRICKSDYRGASGCKLIQLGHGCGSVLFENVAATEMALVVEVVMDRGMGRPMQSNHLATLNVNGLRSVPDCATVRYIASSSLMGV
jgi:hypothetical protein